MENQLEQLKRLTTIVADTGDIEAIRRYQPQDATTNPSLLLKAAEMPQYAALLTAAVNWARTQTPDPQQQLKEAADKLAVSLGCGILNLVPGRISTEVDARLSFDTQASIDKARNAGRKKQATLVSSDDSRVEVWVVPTNEEREIALQSIAAVS